MDKDGEHLPPPPKNNHMTLTRVKIEIIKLWLSSNPAQRDEARRAYEKHFGPTAKVTSELNALTKDFVLGCIDYPNDLCYAGSSKTQSTNL